MRFTMFLKVLVLLLALHVGGAGAVGTLIPAAGRVDMVHDAARGVVYITDQGNVLRYDVTNGAFLAPIEIGGQLNGIDLSPDGNTLAVADRASSVTEVWVHVVQLDTLSVSRLLAPKAFYEGGSWTVAFAGDGTLFVTTQFNGSGWVPMRRYDFASATWTTLASVRQDTMLSASGDGNSMALAQSNSSDGPWGVYKVPTNQLDMRTGYTNGTSAFNWEIAANAVGSQFAIPTYYGTYIYDGTYTRTATIGQYAGLAPIGAAYHPVESRIYFPFAGTREVRVFDAQTLVQVDTLDFENDFAWTGNHAFAQGRTRLSRDGSLLLVTVSGGVRMLRMYEPLAAQPVDLTTAADTPAIVPLAGSIGNGAALAYSVAQPPANGTISIAGDNLTYTPNAGFSGTDTFVYRVRYGAATVDSPGTVTVTPPPNHPPVAVNDSAVTARNVAVSIPVLANDSDPDGDALTIVGVSGVTSGSVVIQGNDVVYTPPRNFVGTSSFTYTVADGGGETASASVVVKTNKR